VNLANEIMNDPDRAPLPAGPAELPDVEPALRECIALGCWAQADRYYDRVRNMYVERGSTRVARMLEGGRPKKGV